MLLSYHRTPRFRKKSNALPKKGMRPSARQGQAAAAVCMARGWGKQRVNVCKAGTGCCCRLHGAGTGEQHVNVCEAGTGRCRCLHGEGTGRNSMRPSAMREPAAVAVCTVRGWGVWHARVCDAEIGRCRRLHGAGSGRMACARLRCGDRLLPPFARCGGGGEQHAPACDAEIGRCRRLHGAGVGAYGGRYRAQSAAGILRRPGGRAVFVEMRGQICDNRSGNRIGKGVMGWQASIGTMSVWRSSWRR